MWKVHSQLMKTHACSKLNQLVHSAIIMLCGTNFEGMTDMLPTRQALVYQGYAMTACTAATLPMWMIHFVSQPILLIKTHCIMLLALGANQWPCVTWVDRALLSWHFQFHLYYKFYEEVAPFLVQVLGKGQSGTLRIAVLCTVTFLPCGYQGCIAFKECLHT